MIILTMPSTSTSLHLQYRFANYASTSEAVSAVTQNLVSFNMSMDLVLTASTTNLTSLTVLLVCVSAQPDASGAYSPDLTYAKISYSSSTANTNTNTGNSGPVQQVLTVNDISNNCSSLFGFDTSAPPAASTNKEVLQVSLRLGLKGLFLYIFGILCNVYSVLQSYSMISLASHITPY